MVSGPFVLPFHTQPIPSFHSEWWAAALGLAATCGLWAARRELRLPWMLAVPGLLLAMLLLQFALGRLVFVQLGLLHALYLLWAGLLLVLGRHLANTLGLAALVDVLAIALVLGGLAAAAAAIAQWLGIADAAPWVFPRLGGSIQANVGQSNHHAHHSFLAIASLFHLRGRTWLSRPLFWLLLTTIGFGTVLGSSRSVFLYALVVLGAVLLARGKDRRSPVAGLLVDAALLVPLLVALSMLGTWAASAGGGGSEAPTSGLRLYEQVSGSSARLAILRTGWAAFLESPWLGQGAGSYSWASFVAATAHDPGAQFMVSEHAHNLILNLLVEFGAPATLAVLAALAAWAFAFLRQPWQAGHGWCAAVLGIGAVHSLLEYPLWYSYFLGPTALLLGAAGAGRGLVLAGRRAFLYVAFAALAGGVVLAGLRADYAVVETATYRPFAGHPDRELAWRMSVQNLLRLHRESLLSPWVLRAFNVMAEPGAHLAAERADLCQLGLHLTPARALVTRCAIHLAVAGRDAEARRLTSAALRAFPAERAATLGELAVAAKDFAAVEPLRAYAELLRAGPRPGAAGS